MGQCLLIVRTKSLYVHMGQASILSLIQKQKLNPDDHYVRLKITTEEGVFGEELYSKCIPHYVTAYKDQ